MQTDNRLSQRAINLVISSTWLLNILIATEIRRAYYADGSYNLLQALEAKAFVFLHPWQSGLLRYVHEIFIQFPIRLSLGLGLADIKWIETLYNFNLLAGPFLLVLFSAVLIEREKREWFPVILASSFVLDCLLSGFAFGAVRWSISIFWIAFIVGTLNDRSQPWHKAVYILSLVALAMTYEPSFLCILGLTLCYIYKRGRKSLFSWIQLAIGLLLTAAMLLVALNHSGQQYFISSTKSLDTISPAVLLLVIALVLLLTVSQKVILWVTVPMLLGAMGAFSARWNLFWESYVLRTMGVPAVILVSAFIFWREMRSRRVIIGPAVIAVLVLGSLYQQALNLRWVTYMNRVHAQLEMSKEGFSEVPRNYFSSSYKRYAEHAHFDWSMPCLSILLQGRTVNRILLSGDTKATEERAASGLGFYGNPSWWIPLRNGYFNYEFWRESGT